MTGVLQIMDTALYTRLTTYAAGTAFYGVRVYDSVAPQTATFPYVMFQLTAGGETNQAQKRVIDVEYRVECVSDTHAGARTGAGHIEDALRLAPLALTGWAHIATTQEQLYSLVDNIGGKLYHRRGAFYRIRMSK